MFGYWDALYFIYVLVIGMLIAHMLSKWAEKVSMGTRRSGDGTKIFISGEDEEKVIPQFEHFRGYVTGRHTMWGLIRGIHRMFLIFRREHNGLLTDYVAYLLITTAVVLGALVIWG